MQWSDEGFVLAARKHGEAAAIVTLLTREHGRHAGLVRGGAGRRQRAVYQTGNRLAATWRARLSEHLGTYSCELMRAYAAEVMDDRGRLAALSAATAVLDAALPEREPNAEAFEDFAALLDSLLRPGWEPGYVRWELALLADLGFGLDLESCAATGATDNLVYVSPRTGRAVSAGAGAPYRDRLLALPGFLTAATAASPDSSALVDGLTLTGHFLHRHVLAPDGRDLPPARQRLVDLIGRVTTISGSDNTS